MDVMATPGKLASLGLSVALANTTSGDPLMHIDGRPSLSIPILSLPPCVGSPLMRIILAVNLIQNPRI